ncbi:hypothetical protein L1987_60233 [Smallanthus sonchifolius]|uniref:Uncharacterized protein n=1 Tax=Smallanthus sonchifolius TaxID=185202 RepID=A0ACB9D834_9ASTR|nr:hypothetical protein L1987_60233 [Smallanthus sonchifolius]
MDINLNLPGVTMGELSFFLGLQVNQKEDGFFIHQSKYVKDILSRFKMEDCTPYDTPIPVNHKFNSDPEGKDVDCRLYRAMIGSLMYLTASRPDIMFAVCICSRFQAKPKESHLIAVKRIFRYLKGKQCLRLWYPHGSNFDFNAYTDSDFGGCCLDRKSTTGGCQFLGNRLVSWQCKKQTTVSISTCEAEYIAAASCCSQILWIQQQLRDYDLNFIGTPMLIDNNATMSITNNPVKQTFQETRIHCSIRILSIQQQRLDTQSSLKFPGYFGLAGVAVKIVGTQAVDAGTLSCRSLSILYCFE